MMIVALLKHTGTYNYIKSVHTIILRVNKCQYSADEYFDKNNF